MKDYIRSLLCASFLSIVILLVSRTAATKATSRTVAAPYSLWALNGEDGSIQWGTLQPGWPYPVRATGPGIDFASEPLVADLDANGRAEVIFAL
ncbi:MAG: hypothetical protein R3248_14055 [Candidatus Promineifilaceae bacterium]|nr:hypothetical protein [Candidatus Promineifilaceae bacterium]